MNQLLQIELNEISFPLIERYAAAGQLPNFKAFLGRHGYHETSSETAYHELEPWIQWVTAHTGKSFAQHGVFRLGDIVKHDHEQIWERLEARGIRTGAISPMNASLRTPSPQFFVPDPWTPTGLVAPDHVVRMHRAIAQAVADNASERVTLASLLDLLVGAARTTPMRNWPWYMEAALTAIRKPWYRALVLDSLLADLFIGMTSKSRPRFASLFLNAGAHIQHHYMASSPYVDGQNPAWYIEPGEDPLFDVYHLYDRILGQICKRMPEARIFLVTGLHQDLHEASTRYWRLKDHSAFLRAAQVPHIAVEPRMSRDFLIHCADEAQALEAEARLSTIRVQDGETMFSVDNRGTELFVELIYGKDINPDMHYTVGNTRHEGLRDAVVFVAIKNGQHNGKGFFADSGLDATGQREQFPLAELPRRVEAALGL